MSIWNAFWSDERGAVISAELALIGTLGVLGMTVGLHEVNTAVNAEMADVARAFRSLDQSYVYQGHKSAKAYSAGSSYSQEPVDEAIASLCIGGDVPEQTAAKTTYASYLVPQNEYLPSSPVPADEKLSH
jgi:Flp pilus assembly pilin Flp